MTKKIVKRTDANNETLYFYTHSDAVDVGEGSSTKSLTEVIDDTLHKSAQTLTNAEKTQVYANLGLNGVDDVPTDNSNNVVRSGGVKAAIDDVIDDFTNRGFMYKGIAPASAPLGEDKTFYIAKSGDYTAYTGIGDGSFTLNGIAVLTYATTTASGAWTKNDIVLFDDEPTAGSEDLVKSGGVDKYADKLYGYRYFEGKGSTYVNKLFKVVPGHIYRIVLKHTSWDYGTINPSANIIFIGWRQNESAAEKILLYNKLYSDGVVLPRSITVTVPSDAGDDVVLEIGGRAASNTKVWFALVDITDVLTERDRATVAEQTLDAANKREDLFLFGSNVNELVGYVSHTNGPHRVDDGKSHYYLIPVKAGDKITANANRYSWCIFASRTVYSNNETYTYATGYSANVTIKPNEVVVPADGTWFYITKDYNTIYGVTEILVNDVDVLGGGLISQASNIAKIGGIDIKVNNLDAEVNGEEWKNKEYIGYYNGEKWGGVYGKYKFKVIPINPGDTIDFRSNSIRTNVLSDFNGVGGTIALSTQTVGAEWNHVGYFVGTAGSDAKYLMFYTLFNGVEKLPTNIFINGIDIYKDTHLKANVKDLSARVATIEGDGSIVALNGGETHMKLIMDNLVRKQGTPSSFTGSRPFVLLYFSDIHGKLNGSTEIKNELAISRIVAFKEKYSSYLSDTLHGGDGVYTSMGGESTLDYEGAEGILNTIGNHDVFISSSTFADAQAAYNKFLAGKIENWGVEYTENLCYYYKDYAVSKLRLIILDCMHWDSAQNTWLAATLADAAENGISVVICDHYVPNARFTILREECTFSTLYPGNIASGGSLNAQASATVQAAMDDDTHPLDFVCWLFGHTHRDYFGYLTDYPNQYGICIAKASGGYSGWEQDSVRTEGTKAYDCLNLISVDTTAKMLSITRLGNNTDRFMRQKNYLAFDYINHKIVGNS